MGWGNGNSSKKRKDRIKAGPFTHSKKSWNFPISRYNKNFCFKKIYGLVSNKEGIGYEEVS